VRLGWTGNSIKSGIAFVISGASFSNVLALKEQAGDVVYSNGGVRYGASVAKSGNNIFVGAPQVRATMKGAADMYIYNSGNQTVSAVPKRISSHNGADNDRFGNSVAASGNFLVIGAPNDDTGAFADSGSASFFNLTLP
jgi:hypothetical protein